VSRALQVDDYRSGTVEEALALREGGIGEVYG
jgi:hypothetical protein